MQRVIVVTNKNDAQNSNKSWQNEWPCDEHNCLCAQMNEEILARMET